MKKMHVIAVIPAHNAAKTLADLLADVIKQKYDQIFVIDDASTDETVKIARTYGPKVKVIKNSKNVGSGANRNRIIGRVDDVILHFIDADMRLISKNTPRIIRNLKWPKDTAYVGGLVRNPDGTQNPFNFGPRPSLVINIQSVLVFAFWLIGNRYNLMGKALSGLFNPLLRDWPNIYKSPVGRRTFWTSESNMIIKSETFAAVGGYDPSFKYSEINDYSLRMYRLGLKTYFNPEIDVLHRTMDNIYKRRHKKYDAHKQFIKKYGHIAFWLPRLADYLSDRRGAVR